MWIRRCRCYTYLLLVLLGSTFHFQASAQDVDEFVLTFAYPAIGQVYVNAALRGDQPMVAAGELLNLLFIPYQRSSTGLGLKGAYPKPTDLWEIDPVKYTLIIAGKSSKVTASEFYLGQTDLYLTPDLFKRIFGFDLTVNMYGLMLTLQSETILPVDERYKRQQIRAQLKNQAPENALISHPMLYPRKRALLALGMLDYNINYATSTNFNQLTYNLNLGAELLGGDIQAGLGGVSSNLGQATQLGGVRWRYVFKSGLNPLGNPSISDITLGQINLGGPNTLPIRGVSVSNNPIIPRRVLDVFAIEGFTTPDSEVELLIGGQLVDFTRADELGYYRFNTPITYGTVRIGLRIYTPRGEVISEDRQLLIPFNFVPRGVLTYNFQTGYEQFGDEVLTDKLVSNADMSYGLTNNITIKAGANRGLDSTGTRIQPYGSVSTRIFDQYLINLETQPGFSTRLNGSVFYANNTSMTANYLRYGPDGILLTRGTIENYNVSYFFPFYLAKQASGIRVGLDNSTFTDGFSQSFQGDLNTRIGPLVTRVNYRREYIQRADSLRSPQQLVTLSLTYTIPRVKGVPVFVRGMFLRTQLRSNFKQIDASALGSFQFSQTVFKNGRLTLSYDRDFVEKGNQFQIGFIYDFNKIRTANITTIRNAKGVTNGAFNQLASGSFGADLKNGAILPTNRDQVGRAGVSVKLFIDENANSKYDKGEEIVSAKAIKLDQSANLFIGSDGILRISQLQSYWTYKLTVDVANLPDPNLAPLTPKFSFVADPNRFKQIEIPLYRTGSIEGKVLKQKAGNFEPQPGLRLHIKRIGDDMPIEPLRTFSDGAFYAYGLLPGDYTVLVDSGQLAFLRSSQLPDTLKFTIRPVPEGDFVEGLEIRLVPQRLDSTRKKDEPLTLAQLEDQLGYKLQESVRAFVESQELFYRGRYEQALVMVDSSINTYNTDVGLALKGSIVYLMGNKRGAYNLWQEARARNPFVIIPDTAKVSPLVDSLFDLVENKPFVSATEDTLANLRPELVEELEGTLGEKLRSAIKMFVEAQEMFYRRRFFEAGALVDSSLNIFVTDHALALKGSISYITGNKREAWRMWEEARERNPHIVLPDIELLERLIKPITETTPRDPKKSYSLNR